MPSSPEPDNEASPHTDDSAEPASPPHVYQSEEIFRGRREVSIEHGDIIYRLRITNSGKLILTK